MPAGRCHFYEMLPAAREQVIDLPAHEHNWNWTGGVGWHQLTQEVVKALVWSWLSSPAVYDIMNLIVCVSIACQPITRANILSKNWSSTNFHVPIKKLCVWQTVTHAIPTDSLRSWNIWWAPVYWLTFPTPIQHVPLRYGDPLRPPSLRLWAKSSSTPERASQHTRVHSTPEKLACHHKTTDCYVMILLIVY